MAVQQPIYLFAGGRGRSIPTTFANFRKVIKNIGKEKPVIAYVGVASLKDNWLIYFILSSYIKMGCNCQIIRAVIAPRNANLQKAQEILKNADAVFISGGWVESGMQILRTKNMVEFFQELACQGQLFIGGSAGSIIMAKEWVRWRNPRDEASTVLFPCLGLVPIICDTSAELDDWAELKTALQLEKDDVVGYGITSGAYLKVYHDGRLEAEVGNVTRFARQNGKIVGLPDLVRADHTG